LRGSDNERLKSPEDTTGVPGKSRWIAAIVGIGTLALCLHTAFVKEPPNYRVVVEASRNVLSGENPYGPELGLDRFKYSPLGGLLMAPFGVLPAGPGLLLFLLGQSVLFFWALGRWSAAAGYPFRSSTALPWIALGSFALDFAVAIQNGQVNVGIWALMLLGGALYAESKPIRSGLALSLATNLKLFPFTLGFCLLTGGNRRFWISLLSGTLLCLLLPAAVVGPGRGLDLHRQWLSLMSRDEAHELTMLDVGSFLELHFGIEAGIRAFLALAAGLVIGLGCWILFRRREEKRLHRFLVPLNGLYVLLFSYLSESPTSVLATGGIFLIGARAVEKRGQAGIYWVAWLTALTLVPLCYSDLAPPDLRDWARAVHLKTVGYLYVTAVLAALFLEDSRGTASAPSRGGTKHSAE
jgi:hypothetical protein